MLWVMWVMWGDTCARACVCVCDCDCGCVRVRVGVESAIAVRMADVFALAHSHTRTLLTFMCPPSLQLVPLYPVHTHKHTRNVFLVLYNTHAQAQRIRARANVHFRRVLSQVHVLATPTTPIPSPRIHPAALTGGACVSASIAFRVSHSLGLAFRACNPSAEQQTANPTCPVVPPPPPPDGPAFPSAPPLRPRPSRRHWHPLSPA